MSDFIIKDESSNHKYRTELPNLIYEIGLTPALIGVYSALKRAAGDNGQCTKSEKTLSNKLFISKKTLHGLIVQLCEVNSFLGKSLIILTNRFSEHGDKDTNAITIVDIWPENYSFFTKESVGRVNSTLPSVNITQPRVESAQGVGQNLPKGRVNFTHKEEPFKKNPIKKNSSSSNPPKKSEGGAELDKKIFLLIEDCRKKELPFSRGALLSIFKETSGSALELTLRKFQKRSKNLKPLDLPDAWLRKNAIVEHEFELQKKEAEGLT